MAIDTEAKRLREIFDPKIGPKGYQFDYLEVEYRGDSGRKTSSTYKISIRTKDECIQCNKFDHLLFISFIDHYFYHLGFREVQNAVASFSVDHELIEARGEDIIEAIATELADVLPNLLPEHTRVLQSVVTKLDEEQKMRERNPVWGLFE